MPAPLGPCQLRKEQRLGNPHFFTGGTHWAATFGESHRDSREKGVSQLEGGRLAY